MTREEAMNLKLCDAIRLNPKYWHHYQIPPVTITELALSQGCQTGVMVTMVNGRGQGKTLDAGWIMEIVK